MENLSSELLYLVVMLTIAVIVLIRMVLKRNRIIEQLEQVIQLGEEVQKPSFAEARRKEIPYRRRPYSERPL